MRNGATRRLPWGLVGMLALIALGERWVARHSLDFTRPEYADWRLSGQAARKQAPGREVLYFGTSMVQQGLLPKVIEERTGWKGYNLATCAGQTPTCYFLLRRALDAGAKPRAVVLDVHPQFLASSYLGASAFWPDLLTAGECLDLARTTRDAHLFADTMTARALPSYKDRLQLQISLMAALHGEKTSFAEPTLVYTRNKARNDGALFHAQNAAFHGEINPSLQAAFLPGSWSCDPINAEYLRRFLALARRHGIPVYWVMPPLCPELRARRNAIGIDAPYRQFAEGLIAEYSNLVVLDARDSGYATTVFTDAAHLDSRGAAVLSADVGDSIRKRSAGHEGPRWVALPCYRERPAPAGETLGQSQLAVRALWEKRR